MANELMNIFDGLLKNTGDKASVEVKKNSMVGKVSLDGGRTKYSKTIYKNGTVHETKTIKR